MGRRGSLLALALGCLTAAAACAQSPALDCSSGNSQAELNRCAAEAFAASDLRLNGAYRKLLNGLDAPQRARLKAAQSAWLRYRDSECEFEARPYLGGSMAPLIRSGCLAALSNERADRLEKLATEFLP